MEGFWKDVVRIVKESGNVFKYGLWKDLDSLVLEGFRGFWLLEGF